MIIVADMTLSFIAMSGICQNCREDGVNVECCGVTCRLRLLEEEEREMMEEEGN
jgi:hypothetical protein